MRQVPKLDEDTIHILEQVERGELTVLAPAAIFNQLLTLQGQVIVSLIGEHFALTSRGLDMLEQWRAERRS